MSLKNLTVSILSFLIAALTLSPANAFQAPPWQGAMGNPDPIKQIKSITTVAEVQVSDGLKYEVTSVWLDHERAIFHRSYPDRAITFGREGQLYWAWDGTKQSDMTPSIQPLIMGHQFQAHLLFLSSPSSAGLYIASQSDQCGCTLYKATFEDGHSEVIETSPENGLPIKQITSYAEHGVITHIFDDWQPIQGVLIPFRMTIDHQGRTFTYVFKQVSFDKPESFNDLKPPYQALTDEQKILRLHRDMIDAHIASDESLMNHIWGQEITFISRGSITHATGLESAARMDTSLSARHHNRYIDLTKPTVSLSNDGSMAWLSAQVYAEGMTISDSPTPFTFTSAWLATFEKQNGLWKMTANASNFQ